MRMVTTQPVGKGQEIFNTYGQMANWQLLHMYGFAEPYPGNTHDTADIQMVTLRRAALQREWHPSPSGRGWGRDLCSTGMTSKISLFHSISGDGAMVFCLLFPLLHPLSFPLHCHPSCVHSSAVFKTGAKSEAQRQLVSEQWDFLCQLEMVGEEGAFVLGWDEVLTEEELSVTLKVKMARWGKSCKREHSMQLGKSAVQNGSVKETST